VDCTERHARPVSIATLLLLGPCLVFREVTSRPEPKPISSLTLALTLGYSSELAERRYISLLKGFINPPDFPKNNLSFITAEDPHMFQQFTYTDNCMLRNRSRCKQ
jgi:hypothetical protein